MTPQINEKVSRTLHAVDIFSQLLELETAALKASDFPVFESLQQDKVVLAQNYQDSILAFEEDLDILPKLDDATKDKLRHAHARFTVAADDNQSALLASKNVSERIVTRIMEAARQTVSEGPAYNAGGHTNISDKIPVHFKLNEVL